MLIILSATQLQLKVFKFRCLHVRYWAGFYCINTQLAKKSHLATGIQDTSKGYNMRVYGKTNSSWRASRIHHSI